MNYVLRMGGDQLHQEQRFDDKQALHLRPDRANVLPRIAFLMQNTPEDPETICVTFDGPFFAQVKGNDVYVTKL